MQAVTIDLYNLFMPAIQFLRDWLFIEVSFAGVSFPIWAIFAFIMLLAIFMRVIGSLGGFDFGDDDTVSHSFHVGGFHD